MTLASHMPGNTVARIFGIGDDAVWRVLHHYSNAARAREDFSNVTAVGTDETAARRGHDYITLFDDSRSRRVLYACEGRDRSTVDAFAEYLRAHGGDPDRIDAVCIDTSKAYIAGVNRVLPGAAITFNVFHVVQLANQAVEQVWRRALVWSKSLKRSRWIWPKDHSDLTEKQIRLFQSWSCEPLEAARAWRLNIVFSQDNRKPTRCCEQPSAFMHPGRSTVSTSTSRVCAIAPSRWRCPTIDRFRCSVRSAGRTVRAMTHGSVVWRHLEPMQFRKILVAQVPRVRCPTLDVRQMEVPWTEDGSPFTAPFEMLVIGWYHEASFAALARRLCMSWNQVAGIQDRAVARGLARRDLTQPKTIGVDETSFKKGHDYVTVVNDLEAPGHVLHVAEGRRQGALGGFFERVGEDSAHQIEQVAMNMWPAYIKSTGRHAPPSADRLRQVPHREASRRCRRQSPAQRTASSEHKASTAQGDHRRKKTKYLWLRKPKNMSMCRWRDFADLRKSELEGGAGLGDQADGHESLGIH